MMFTFVLLGVIWKIETLTKGKMLIGRNYPLYVLLILRDPVD
jgi:hypothetical protein